MSLIATVGPAKAIGFYLGLEGLVVACTARPLFLLYFSPRV